MAKDGDEARRFARKILGTYTIPGTLQHVLDLEGISGEVEEIKARYLEGDLDAAVSSVTDDLVDRFAVVGNPDECLEKLRKHIGTELKCPILYIHGPVHRLALQLTAEEVAPKLVSSYRDRLSLFQG